MGELYLDHVTVGDVIAAEKMHVGPVTIGDLKRTGKLLEIGCMGCSRHLYVDPASLPLPDRFRDLLVQLRNAEFWGKRARWRGAQPYIDEPPAGEPTLPELMSVGGKVGNGQS